MQNDGQLPFFDVEIQQEWYKSENTILNQAKARDMSWLLCRMEDPDHQRIPAWTGFNHVVSQYESEVTRIGHMPILPVPADDMDTIYTVIARCKYIAELLNISHTIMTFDQALYCRAKELVWSNQPGFKNVIISHCNELYEGYWAAHGGIWSEGYMGGEWSVWRKHNQ